MTPQVWIILAAFIIQVLYSIIAASISEEYRELSFDNKVSMGIYYFMTVLSLAVILIYGVNCSIRGDSSENSCKMYSWLICLFVVTIILFTIIRSMILVLKSRKSEKEQNVENKNIE
jgi:hypothetical protein